MAVTKMKLVNVIGQMKSLDDVVYACGCSGVFQPDDAMTFFSDTSGFMAVQEENPYTAPLSLLESSVTRVGGKTTPAVPPSTRRCGFPPPAFPIRRNREAPPATGKGCFGTSARRSPPVRGRRAGNGGLPKSPCAPAP